MDCGGFSGRGSRRRSDEREIVRCAFAILALALLVSACAQHRQQPAATKTLEPMSLSVYDNVIATPFTPVPSLPPLTPAQRLELKWRRRGWNEIASTNNRIFLVSQNGLQVVRAADDHVLWRNSTCIHAGGLVKINDELFTSCTAGTLSVLSANSGRILRGTHVPMFGVTEVVAAGKRWLAVDGWSDGAALVNRLVILNTTTLKPVTADVITDGTFLGVIGDRAYIDDWCCNGRADQYRPATIYSISLLDGTHSVPIDLTPDPDKHPANLQPIGQGEHNYMRGHYLYVPVDNVLYRYNILHLNLAPSRTHIQKQIPQGAQSQAEVQR